MNARLSEDTEMLRDEHDTYIPEDDEPIDDYENGAGEETSLAENEGMICCLLSP